MHPDRRPTERSGSASAVVPVDDELDASDDSSLDVDGPSWSDGPTRRLTRRTTEMPEDPFDGVTIDWA